MATEQRLKKKEVDRKAFSNPQLAQLKRKYKILLVNDDKFQLIMSCSIIKNYGPCEIITAMNGDLAVREIQKNMLEFYKFQNSSKRK